ncbi:L-dopachrome tautomerase-related protein [Caballeronia sp. LZ034LL]|uniref:L-dopachrome tautomerase-related protein n=1 Tax=Caballeronia sp. LZ034LL TaxID=3038567 RepID=UPI0028584549|nr:L-dopachrome tautomerase-related protein [Caballeronia sp. LZ034LL]MDR5835928.1 L-dopachrome tautomerase-related protein [Caballeronia sp. LZ034LL]
MQPYRRYLIALGAALCAHAALAGDADDPAWRTSRDEHANSARLQLVASFDHQVTGVTVAPDGRMFVNFPRWTEDAPLSVAEVGSGGDLRPYPDAEWNTWRNARRDEVTPGDHWVCVQSVVADTRGNLWVIDPGAPAQSLIVPGAPKLVRIDLASNRVARTYAFDESIAPQGSYLNDVRISPDGRTAYITDSGVRGAIVVVDIESGVARRVLDGDPSTQADKSVTVTVNGKPLQQTDGRRVSFAADGIALTPDGRYLYWQAVKGKTLYRIATDALQNAQLGADQVASRVEAVGVDGPADGLWIDPRGRLYVSSVEHHAIRVRQGERFATLVRDRQLIWPDTFSEGPDGTIYVTDSRIPDMSWYQPQNPAALPTRLYAIRR